MKGFGFWFRALTQVRVNLLGWVAVEETRDKRIVSKHRSFPAHLTDLARAPAES